MYQETFVKTEKGETKQVIPVAVEKPRTDRRKKSSTRSTDSGGRASFLETSVFLHCNLAYIFIRPTGCTVESQKLDYLFVLKM
jgi:hypothetical protein